MWETLIDDSPFTMDEYAPVINDDNRWYGTYQEGELISLWYAHRLNHIMWQVHAHFRPCYWGKGFSTAHGKRALEGIFKSTKAKKLYGQLPDNAKQVAAFVKRIGFKQEGRSKRAWQKNGKLHDLIHIGVYI